MREVIAKDENGVNRCWGTGDEWAVAYHNCVTQCYEYLNRRKDIQELQIFMDNERVATIGRDVQATS